MMQVTAARIQNKYARKTDAPANPSINPPFKFKLIFKQS
jgi:hypothetical protein